MAKDEKPHNAADPNSVKKQGQEEKRKRDLELADVKWLLSDARGRRFIWRYLNKGKVFEHCMTGNNTTFYNLGMRNIGLMILADVNEAHPEMYLKMMSEAKGDKNG